MNKRYSGKWPARGALLLLLAIVSAGCASNNEEALPSQTSIQKPGSGDGASVEPGDRDFADKELNVAVFEGGYGKAYWEAVKERFEADYPGVHIKLTSNPKIMDVIKPQIVAGHPPDFIYIPPGEGTGTIQAMLKDHGLLDLTDVFEGKAPDVDVPLKDKLLDGILEYAKPLDDGKIYYAPSYISTTGLWYNKALFAAKQWTPPKTWDAFFALGDKAKAAGRALYTYQGIFPSYNEMVLWPAVASAGGPEALARIENYEENAFKTDAVRSVLNIFERIAQNGYLLPGTVALNHTQAQTEFLKGKALFIPNGSWFENEMKDVPKEDGFEWGFMAAPVFKEGDTQYAQTSFEAYYIPAKAKNIELAKEFLRYQYRDDIVKLNAEKSQGVMAVKNGTELAKPYISESIYNSLKVFDTGVKPIIFQWKVTPKTEVNVSDEVFNPIGGIMNKSMTTDEWSLRVEKAFGKLRDAMAKGDGQQ